MEENKKSNLLKYFIVGTILFVVGMAIGLIAYPYLFEKNEGLVQKEENKDVNKEEVENDESKKEENKEVLQVIEVEYQEDEKLEYNFENCGTGNLHYTFSFENDKTLVINNLEDGKINASNVVMGNVEKIIKYYNQAACDEFEFVVLTTDGKIYMTKDIINMSEISKFKDMLVELNYSNYSDEKVIFTDIRLAEEIYDLHTEEGLHWSLGIVATTDSGENVFFNSSDSIRYLVK